MGHVKKDTTNHYEALIKRLNKYPVGAPATKEMFQLLALLFKEEEAYAGSQFPLGPVTLKALAKKLFISERTLTQTLGSMMEKGLVIEQQAGKNKVYILTPTIFGFFEFTLMRLDKGLDYKGVAKLMQEIFKGAMAKEFFSSKTQMARALTHEKVLNSISSTVSPYEVVSQIIKSSKYLSIQNCYCRQKKELLDKKCRMSAPINVCMAIGDVARFLVRRGFAKELTQGDALKILEQTEKMGLVHITDNVKDDPQFICHCCGCCCDLLSGITTFGKTDAVNPSKFQIKCNKQMCNRCGRCVKACQVNVFLVKFMELSINIDNCLGCGACIPICPTKALFFGKRPKQVKIPKSTFTRHVAVSKQKGRLHHSVEYLAGTILSGDLLRFLKK